jgi:hypothetical protein
MRLIGNRGVKVKRLPLLSSKEKRGRLRSPVK